MKREERVMAATLAEPGTSAEPGTDGVPNVDDTLDLYILCAHPDLSPASAVALTLHDDRATLEVVEQRGHVNHDNPLDGVSALPVRAEGLHESVVAGSRLWVDRADPWRAVMTRPDAVYTISSDAPPATMAETVSAVVAEDRARVSLPSQTDESFGATVEDGWRTLFR